MKLLILADIDDLHWNHGGGKADVVLSCGDMYDQVILEAARAYSCARIFAVKGNHDADAPFASPITNLHLQVHEQGGLRFGGMNGSWRYKPHGHFLYDQEETQELLRAFPPVDIFLSHNSPRDVHDRKEGIHEGFAALNDYISRAKPAMVIHGHQHANRETVIEETRVVGVYGHRLIKM